MIEFVTTEAQHASICRVMAVTKAFETPRRDREDVVMMIYVRNENHKDLKQKVVIDQFGGVHYKNHAIPQ